MSLRDWFGKRETFSSDKEIDHMAQQMVKAIKRAGSGEPDFAGLPVEKMQKKATWIMLADPNNPEPRHRPGNNLRTYTGVRNPDGNLKDETFKGDALLRTGDTIYRTRRQGPNGEVTYPNNTQDPSLRGSPIRVRYQDDGTVIEDPTGEPLFEEYKTSVPDHPRTKYGVEPRPGEWQIGVAKIPSYLLEIPRNKGKVDVFTPQGVVISVAGGDFLVVDALGDGKASVQAVAKASKVDTYRSWVNNN